MRPQVFLILFTAIRASCAPVPSPSYDDRKLVEKGNHSGIKAALIATFSIAGLLGASIGLTEYITTVYNRYQKDKIERQNGLNDKVFYNERVSADNEFRNTGIDIVLNIVEKYVDGNGAKNEVKKDEKKKLAVEEKQVGLEQKWENAEDEGEEGVLSLPKLPGFPPLSKALSTNMVVRMNSEDPKVEEIEKSHSEATGEASPDESRGCELHSAYPKEQNTEI